MRQYSIACIPGDGIGKEVIAAGRRVLETVQQLDGGFALKFDEFPWGCEYYLQHGEMMPKDGLKILEGYDCVYLGAVGFPSVPDHVSLWGLLLPIRQGFDEYVNYRPVKLLPGINCPLKDKCPEQIDFVCIRENTEGEYAGVGGRVHRGTDREVAIQTGVFTRAGVERVLRYAFQVAQGRPRKQLMSATKSNACQYSMVFWDEMLAKVGEEFPDVKASKSHVDALAAQFVLRPEALDVVVASNLFGDILTDLGAALQGGLGIPASANLNPEKRYPSMFEPVHGSAPDIAGRGIADPIAAIWAGAAMIEFLGEKSAADAVLRAIESVTAEGRVVTPDLGGGASTDEMAAEIAAKLRTATS